MTDIIFVDTKDEIIGAGSKQEAHQNGIRHRVVRNFLTNANGDVLLQKRAPHIFSSPDKWCESAAGHVDEGETYEQAAYREMKEEIGVTGVVLTEVGYYYSEEVIGEGPTKFRFNRLYTGKYDGEIQMDPEEVSETKWISKTDLDEWMEKRPQDFTVGCLKAYKFVRKLL